MTTIISRLYETEATANQVLDALRDKGFPDKFLGLVTGGQDTAARIEATRVDETAAAAYAPMVDNGNALVVVHAPISPFGAARTAMEIVDSHPTVDAGVEDENVYIREEPRMDHYKSVLEDHPLFLTSKHRPKGVLVSEAFGFPVLSPHKERNSAIPGGRHVSTTFVPLPLVSTPDKPKDSVISGGKHFLLMSPVKARDRKLSVRKGGGHPLSEIFGWPLLTNRR